MRPIAIDRDDPDRHLAPRLGACRPALRRFRECPPACSKPPATGTSHPTNGPSFTIRARVFVSVGTGNRSAIDDLPPGDSRELRLGRLATPWCTCGDSRTWWLDERPPPPRSSSASLTTAASMRCPFGTRSHLPSVPVRTRQCGDASSARKDYETFFQLWKDADSRRADPPGGAIRVRRARSLSPIKRARNLFVTRR